MATYQQGVLIDGLATVYGLAQRVQTSEGVEIVTAPDENGEVAAAVQFNPEKTVSFEFIRDADTALPSLSAARLTPVYFDYDSDGSDGSGTSERYLVDKVDDGQENKGFRTCTISGRRWTKNIIPAAASGS